MDHFIFMNLFFSGYRERVAQQLGKRERTPQDILESVTNGEHASQENELVVFSYGEWP